MSLLLASKFVVPSHIHLGIFTGFCIISLSKLVEVTWDDERAFNLKFETSSIPRDYHFWDLVSATFSSSLVMFSHYCFPHSLHFLISFLHIPYPACRHITSFFLSPYLFPELFYTVLRWCFFYHNLAFLYFSIEFFGIYLEDFILPAEFVTFIKLSFHLCFCLYSLLQFLFDTSNINVICDLILSYSIPGFSCV